jgi:hypothetical protein
VQHSRDFYNIPPDSINDDKWKRRQDELASAINSAQPPRLEDWEMIRAEQRNQVHGMRNAIGSGRILLVDVRDNSRKIGRGFRRPFDFHRETQSRTEDSVHLAAHVLVGDGFALIERGKALANLLPKPFVMIKVGRNQLAHHLVWSFACLRGDPG